MIPKNEDPAKKYARQQVCVHKFDAWYTPYWDPNRKYRTCLNCEYVESRYIGW